jgi:NAD+ synthase (glutamine-hydrolysing)
MCGCGCAVRVRRGGEPRRGQTDLHTELSSKVDAALGVVGGDFAKGQLRSYMRTPVIYYVAQLTSQAGFPCVVMGTGNKDEDGAGP